MRRLGVVATVLLLSLVGTAFAAPINQIAPGLLTGTGLVTFDDVAGGAAPGTNYDSLFLSGNVAFGERFTGQSLSFSGTLDVISGTPSAGLSLLTGAPGRNLNVFINGTSNVLTGLGNLGFPDFNAIGEGAISFRFGLQQSEFGFDLVGGNSGHAFVSFFHTDGSLIDTIDLAGLSDQSYAFSREGGVEDIAGITIYNNDLAGIGFDNLRYNVEGGDPLPVPEPATLVLLGTGLAGLALVRRKRIQCSLSGFFTGAAPTRR